MNTKVNLSQVKKDAVGYFLQGKFYCSEAIVAVIRDHIDNSMPKELIAAASGFPVGIGMSKCVCGAVTGGVIAIGYFFGRTEGSDPADPKSVRTLQLADELGQLFRRENKGMLCCEAHISDLEFGSEEHRRQCAGYTGEMAVATARIIARELELELIA